MSVIEDDEFLPELTEVFGYLPSFHDAHVLSIRLLSRNLFLELYIYEQPADGKWKQDWDRDLHAVVTLAFFEVREATMYFADNWLYYLQLKTSEAGVAAEALDQESGKLGSISAARVEVQSIQYPDKPFIWQGESIDTIKFQLIVSPDC